MRTIVALALLAAALIQATAADQSTEEYRVKGAFLLNCASYVAWPAKAFKGPQDAISICVLGTSLFAPELDAAARKTVAQNRPVTVQQIPDPQHATGCQIVFVSISDRRRVHALFDALRGSNVLTVGESEGFIADGGVIEFRVEDSRVRMEISEAAAKRAGLTISSRLLNLVQSGKR
jgi:hypothetical protein